MESIAIVTGTTRGVGRSLALDLLRRGWRVLGAARSEAPEDLSGTEGYRHTVLDLDDLGAVEAWARSGFGDPEGLRTAERIALVNNAGILAPIGPLDGLRGQDLERAGRVNLWAPMLLIGGLLRLETEACLRIANLSSGAAKKGYPGWAAYCTTKAGLAMVGQVLEAEFKAFPHLEDRDIAVLSYAPGVVDTGMQAEIRSTPEAEFPMRPRFEALNEEGELVDPARPATELADLLESGSLPPLSEHRLGG